MFQSKPQIHRSKEKNKWYVIPAYAGIHSSLCWHFVDARQEFRLLFRFQNAVSAECKSGKSRDKRNPKSGTFRGMT